MLCQTYFSGASCDIFLNYPITFRVIWMFFWWWSTFSIWQPASWLGYANVKEQMDDVPKEKRRFIS